MFSACNEAAKESYLGMVPVLGHVMFASFDWAEPWGQRLQYWGKVKDDRRSHGRTPGLVTAPQPE